VLRQNFGLDLHLEFAGVSSFTQNPGQELRPSPKDVPNQFGYSIILIAQFQSGIAEQSAADELCLPLLLQYHVEQA
jgi:hypothetical protein